MKYKCLVLDHDDTVVNSTATIHYPSFVEYMKIKRPEIQMDLNEYFRLNFDPGVIGLFVDICGLSQEELKEEEAFWSDYVKDHIPLAYPGMKEILESYKEKGGLIAVVSHSYSNYIRRDYQANHLPEPDLIFGWDLEPEKRKPDPYCLYEIERRFDLKPEDLLVLDDLKPGYDMAKAAGVTFAAAGWANDIPEIESFMRENCDAYFKHVEDFGRYILDE
ncbi:MAG: HAD family phosphatase [Firmicutes bacterium]|nr:HAD family phosphatase [Bacillota bacterium]